MPHRFMQIEPQPARGVLQESMWDSPEWIAEEKYDGDRRIAQFCGKYPSNARVPQGLAAVRFTGRRKSVDGSGFVEKTENVPHLSGALPPYSEARGMFKSHYAEIRALEGTVLDGEMICTDGHVGRTCEDRYEEVGGLSKYVTSIMGSLPEEAVRKQIERGWLRYVVFDCLFYKGRDLRSAPWTTRHGFMRKAVEEWRNPFASAAPFDAGEDKRDLLKEIMARGGEGVILKHIDHIYGEKKLWVKVKGTWTADVVIMGYKDAKEMSTKKGDDAPSMTKYAKAGLIGAVVVGQYRSATAVEFARGANPRGPHALREVATISGMTDALRAKLTQDGKKYLGRVVRIEHNGREPTGRFRHPRWDDFRDDKAAKDCIYHEGEI